MTNIVRGGQILLNEEQVMRHLNEQAASLRVEQRRKRQKMAQPLPALPSPTSVAITAIAFGAISNCGGRLPGMVFHSMKGMIG